MTNKTTRKTIGRLLSKGLTGWEAGKLVLQDLIDANCGRNKLLTEGDMAKIRQGLRNGTQKDTTDYNNLIDTYRIINKASLFCKTDAFEACLTICFLYNMLRDANLERFISWSQMWQPCLVTEKQYQDIVAAQKKVKLKSQFSLAYVIQDRFFWIAPSEVKEDIYNLGLDMETGREFEEAVKAKYTNLYTQAVNDIHALHTTGKFGDAFYYEEDEDIAKPLLKKWQKEGLKAKEAEHLVDVIFVSGQQLYNCGQLPEWKEFIDNYQRGFADDKNERFMPVYAIVQDPWEGCLDKKAYYDRPFRAAEFIIRNDEQLLGLKNNKRKKTETTIKKAALNLKFMLKQAELNIREYLAVKLIIDTASDVIGVSFSDEFVQFVNVQDRLEAHVTIYNLELERLNEETYHKDEPKLIKVLKKLSPIDMDKLKTSAASIQELKANITTGLEEPNWIIKKVHSLKYEDGYSFENGLVIEFTEDELND